MIDRDEIGICEAIEAAAQVLSIGRSAGRGTETATAGSISSRGRRRGSSPGIRLTIFTFAARRRPHDGWPRERARGGPCGAPRTAAWVVWRLEERDGKATKVPWRADGFGRASSTDRSTWASFETAVAAVEGLGVDGVGFVFDEGTTRTSALTSTASTGTPTRSSRRSRATPSTRCRAVAPTYSCGRR